MPGLDPGIQLQPETAEAVARWIAGSRPAMTMRIGIELTGELIA
jgi:hypothetical protein